MTIQHAEWHPTDDEIRFENDAEIFIEEDKISVHGNNDKQDNNNQAIDAVELNSSNEVSLYSFFKYLHYHWFCTPRGSIIFKKFPKIFIGSWWFGHKC